MAAHEPAGNSHLKTSEPNNECTPENLPPAKPENRTKQGHPLQETLSSDPGNDSRVVHQSGLPEDVHAASVRVCEVMDKLGYSEAMVRHRQEAYRKYDIMQNFATISGSKGEGLSTPFESDTDYLSFTEKVLCRLPGYASLQLPDINTVCIMDGEHCHPGHYWLELDHMRRVEDTNIKASLFVHTNGKTYLSSQKFTERKRIIEPTGSVSGPAVVTQISEILSADTVYALPIQQQMLSEWTSRPRYHSWPSPELIQEISQLPAYLVPVGCKGSETKHMEWRLGFLGEQKLTDSFTECQYKLYIVFKFLMKEELKSICDEMSSYIVKNIVFWFIESTQQELFSKENLLEHLLSCLQMLQQAIRDNHLSYFMIPGRNLLIGRINQSQQQQLIAKLDALIQEGPRVMLRCPKVLEALYNMSPTELTEKGQRRDEIEKLWLEMSNLRDSSYRPGMSYDEYIQWIMTDQAQYILEKIRDIVWPLWRLYPFESISNIYQKKYEDALS